MMYWDYPSVTPADRLAHLAPRSVDDQDFRQRRRRQGGSRGARRRPADDVRGPADLSVRRPRRRGGRVRGHGRRAARSHARRRREDRADVVGPERQGGAASRRSIADQWTLQNRVRDLQPLWKFSWPDGQQLYVSQANGDVIQYTTQRLAHRRVLRRHSALALLHAAPTERSAVEQGRHLVVGHRDGRGDSRPDHRRLDVTRRRNDIAMPARRRRFPIAAGNAGTRSSVSSSASARSRGRSAGCCRWSRFPQRDDSGDVARTYAARVCRRCADARRSRSSPAKDPRAALAQLRWTPRQGTRVGRRSRASRRISRRIAPATRGSSRCTARRVAELDTPALVEIVATRCRPARRRDGQRDVAVRSVLSRPASRGAAAGCCSSN